MHYTAAAAIARDAIDTSSVIALANRERLLGAGEAAAAEMAALDAASAALHALAQVRQAGAPDSMSDVQSERLSALLDAAWTYNAMRQQECGLECDAAAGSMTGTMFARALCAVADLPWCPACRIYQAPEALHVCTAPDAPGVATPGVALRYDRGQRAVVVSHGGTETVQDLGALLMAMGVTFADIERAFTAAQRPPTQSIYRIVARGSAPRDGRLLPKTGPNWSIDELRDCLRRTADLHRAAQGGAPPQTQPLTDADLILFAPHDWQIVTYEVRERSRQDIAAFLATNPTI